MATDQFWTIVGLFIASTTTMTVLFNRKIDKLDTKIDSVATRLDTKIDSVAAELRQEIRDQTVRIDMLNAAVNQVVKDVGELKGYMVVVSERLNIPKSA